jgi:hypothetical protein
MLFKNVHRIRLLQTKLFVPDFEDFKFQFASFLRLFCSHNVTVCGLIR